MLFLYASNTGLKVHNFYSIFYVLLCYVETIKTVLNFCFVICSGVAMSVIIESLLHINVIST